MRTLFLCGAALLASCATPHAPRHTEPVDPPGPPGEWHPPPPSPSLGTADVLEAVLSQKAALVHCVTQHRELSAVSGRAFLRWTFSLSGATREVEVTDAPEPLATCLRGAVAAMHTRPHTVAFERVTFPVKY